MPLIPYIMYSCAEPVATYLLEEYQKDMAGFNVTHSVHVEACWPGDPVGETK